MRQEVVPEEPARNDEREVHDRHQGAEIRPNGLGIVHRRTETTGPQTDGQTPDEPTTLVVNFLQFVGAGWHTTADAMLANTSAALAREHEREVQQQIAAMAA